MRNSLLKLAVLSALGVSAQAMATGLVPLPLAGFTTVAGTSQTAGTSAYTRCNTTGNYGAGAATAPTTGANNTCAVFPANINTTPVTGFTIVAAGTSTVSLTGNGGEALASMNQRLFRNSANTSCIYGKSFTMSAPSSFDYNGTRAGVNALEVNDFAFGGFANTATVNAGYFYIPSTTNSPIFRIGRAFTSVQTHNSVPSGGLHTGYIHQPLVPSTALGAVEINGVGGGQPAAGGPVPTAAQQTADIRANWVDFTTDVTGGPDEDGGGTDPASAMMYVQADCTSAAPVTLTDSVILRQTGQETQPWITIKKAGFAVSGANANF